MSGWVPCLLRGFLGVVLLLAGLSKLPDPQVFFSSLAAYELPMPASLQKWLAAMLPWLELLCASLLLFGVWLEAVIWTTICMLAGFTAVTAWAWVRGLDLDCGCFNLAFLESWLGRPLLAAASSPAGATLRNAVLIAAALMLWRCFRRGRVGSTAQAVMAETP